MDIYQEPISCLVLSLSRMDCTGRDWCKWMGAGAIQDDTKREVMGYFTTTMLGPRNDNPAQESCTPLGCRLFSCMCSEDQFAQLDDVSFVDTRWFTGQCMNCGTRLSSPRHAWRYPLHSGGYKGCYCSGSCTSRAETTLFPAQAEDGDLGERLAVTLKQLQFGVLDME